MTASCCRICLEDFLTCCAICAITGSTCDPEWYEAQASSVSRSAARSRYEGVHLELRQALEPWHVLGETGAIGGTVRYTDSSTERLQVKLTAAAKERYAVMCNRRPVPLARPGPPASASAACGSRRGSRRGAASGLPVDAPLTFDIYDTWSGRPHRRLRLPRGASGRAQLRDLPGQRQRGRGPAAGAVRDGPRPAQVPHPEFPLTLDLRRRPGLG
jgi:uncharacterized protein (DUF2126 family)